MEGGEWRRTPGRDEHLDKGRLQENKRQGTHVVGTRTNSVHQLASQDDSLINPGFFVEPVYRYYVEVGSLRCVCGDLLRSAVFVRAQQCVNCETYKRNKLLVDRAEEKRA